MNFVFFAPPKIGRVSGAALERILESARVAENGSGARRDTGDLGEVVLGGGDELGKNRGGIATERRLNRGRVEFLAAKHRLGDTLEARQRAEAASSASAASASAQDSTEAEAAAKAAAEALISAEENAKVQAAKGAQPSGKAKAKPKKHK